MQLLTNAITRALPPMGATSNQEDPMVWVKFFDPTGNWTWYATEYDGADEFFGLVDGFVKELSYFSLSELKAYRGGLGLGIERDLYFEPRRLSELR